MWIGSVRHLLWRLARSVDAFRAMWGITGRGAELGDEMWNHP